MALTCPQCAAPMNEVKAPATTGYLIVLDQCPRCGGIWCDRWELYPITAAAAAQLDSVDQPALRQPVAPADEQLECPRCRARMRRFRDPMLPEDARIERCPNCDGMWLNRGELRRLKDRNATRPPQPVTVPEGELNRLATQAAGDPRSWPTIAHLDDAFEARVADPYAAADAVRHELAAGVGWLILRAALVLLLLHI
ncbi:MAG TPA: zf-TFIIB domain-containing protein [Candidatus Acidoferrales bacterium]|nr:zf-TFIIB domain-containing protein [Candidatus Acidoferrales bacterium]